MSRSTAYGSVLLGCAVLVALGLGLLVVVPARQVVSAEIGTTLSVQVPAGDRGLYTTSSSWRAAGCVLTAEDGEIILRPDMTQQDLLGSPTWYAQGSFRLDRPQTVTATCTGPVGRFGIGPVVAIGGVMLRLLVLSLAVLLAVAGLVVLVVGRARRRA